MLMWAATLRIDAIHAFREGVTTMALNATDRDANIAGQDTPPWALDCTA